ncbi:hypothetical protein HUJ04_005172 [Dendroctonus ponderosae]|nr:hypothetical protein HUJ04_005172 [Dendroctonus ponderosae]
MTGYKQRLSQRGRPLSLLDNTLGKRGVLQARTPSGYVGNEPTNKGNEPYHRNGVGVILDKKFNRAVVNVVPVPDWNLLIQLSGKPITINIIQRCAPTAGKLIKGLEGCYKELVKVTTVTIKEKQDLTFIMGDFNAKLCQGSVGPNCRAWAG